MVRGENVGNTGIVKYGYDDVDGFNEVEKSYLYDDYGRNMLFEFQIENGKYRVTVGAGRPAKGYPNDPHNVVVEGIPIINDVVTTQEAPTVIGTETVELSDGSLSFEVGGKSQTTKDWAYTFLSCVEIVPVD